jgi:predicted nucleic acid-binding protein
MAVVVSDTTPLHYLILVGREAILQSLYRNVIIPPAVLTELSHASAPVQISNWATNPPAWVTVATPSSIPGKFDGLDFGERQALALAQEIHADLVLLDDKVARRVALRELMRVKGTLGIVAEAAKANLLDFVETVEQLQRTSMHLDEDVVGMVIAEYKRSQQGKQGST